MLTRVELEWAVGWSGGREERPGRWVGAGVPGAVQLDWGAAEGWGPYWWGDNFKAYAWMENVYWHYRARIPEVAVGKGERIHFVSKGIDYAFLIRLNGVMLLEQEGMFTPVDLDLTGRVGVTGGAKAGDLLEVVVFPIPKTKADAPDLFKASDYGRQQANQSCKPAMNYGWDFVCRLVPLGIFDETYIEVRPGVHLRRAEVGYTLAEDLSRAEVVCECETGGEGGLAGVGAIRWMVLDGAGGKVIEERVEVGKSGKAVVVIKGGIAGPRLWWPHDQGEPALYRSRVELEDGSGRVADVRESRVGFRRVRLVANAETYPRDFRTPSTQGRPPITMEVNGRRIFCRGSNWVSPEIFPGLVTAERYRELLEAAKSANLNLLRLWGGSMVGKESFYELCDEMGILLWQEFPLACNRYEGTPGYLRVLDQESRSIILRLRGHPSVVMWCGGNELFSPWSGMNEQDLAIRLLNRNCFDLDPGRPFLATSPVMGIGHGDYVFKEDRHHREVFEIIRGSDCSAYVEFGVQGAADVEHLRTFMPEGELFPPRLGTAWETHHGMGAWGPEGWLKPKTIEEYFGPAGDLETLVARSQLMQCEGYKALFEEARRQKPRASMAVNWLFNEPWPSAANLSLVSWPVRAKPALGAVRAACRPVLASARITKFQWAEGEDFCPEIWLLNDSPGEVPAGSVEAVLRVGGEEFPLLKWTHPAVGANENLQGPSVSFKLPKMSGETMTLGVKVVGRPEWDSEYVLVVKR